jgi:hypothetical protein
MEPSSQDCQEVAHLELTIFIGNLAEGSEAHALSNLHSDYFQVDWLAVLKVEFFIELPLLLDLPSTEVLIEVYLQKLFG